MRAPMFAAGLCGSEHRTGWPALPRLRSSCALQAFFGKAHRRRRLTDVMPIHCEHLASAFNASGRTGEKGGKCRREGCNRPGSRRSPLDSGRVEAFLNYLKRSSCISIEEFRGLQTSVYRWHSVEFHIAYRRGVCRNCACQSYNHQDHVHRVLILSSEEVC